MERPTHLPLDPGELEDRRSKHATPKGTVNIDRLRILPGVASSGARQMARGGILRATSPGTPFKTAVRFAYWEGEGSDDSSGAIDTRKRSGPCCVLVRRLRIVHVSIREEEHGQTS